jgi:DNA-binding GntR family transcriptional regulator
MLAGVSVCPWNRHKPESCTNMTPRDSANGAGVRRGRVSEEEIVRRIHDAVIDQRLPPGTKLSEAALCAAFGVGRARVRRSLLVLAGREIVELHANRGAFVARPTPEQARDVFDARRAIEPGLVRRAAARAQPDDLRRLQEHLAAEAEAEAAAHGHRDRRQAIRLSGHFHVMLAETAGNRVLERVVRELVTRTSLIIGMFGGPVTQNCRSDEHDRILAAIRAHDEETGARLMFEHLAHIEAGLDLAGRLSRPVDVVELFAAEKGPAAAG